MKLYRVTTTFLGADAPSRLYFKTAEKAEQFLEKECQNGVSEKVDIIGKHTLNYFDGCTMNDLTLGEFDAKEILLQPEGWVTTKSLGDVYVNEYGNVVRAVSADGQRPLYPYRAHMVQKGFGASWKQDGWDNCSGSYKPAYLARLMREGKAKWA